jgi:hypothetical protein
MLGTDFPAGLDPKVIMATAGDKAKIVQELKDSFAHMRETILAIKDSDLEKPMKLPGNRQSTVRGALFSSPDIMANTWGNRSRMRGRLGSFRRGPKKE